MFSKRAFNIFGFLCCLGGLLFAYYELQLNQNLEPCPLCVLQRIALGVMGVFFLLAALHRPPTAGARVYGTIILLGGIVGAGLASYHLSLEADPNEPLPWGGACTTPIKEGASTMDVIVDATKRAFNTKASCTSIEYWMGLAIPTWCLLGFVFLGLMGFLRNWVWESRASDRRLFANTQL